MAAEREGNEGESPGASLPQGLKPRLIFATVFGTAEAVP